MSRDDLPRFDADHTVDATVAGDEALFIQRFSLFAEGDASVRFESETERCSIGSHPSNDVVLDDPTVSRFHCELRVTEGGVQVRDLSSRNGTRVDGVRVSEAWLKDGSRLRVGRPTLVFGVGGRRNRLPISEKRSLGTMVGVSVPMRAVFAQLERVAPSEATVLLNGETGTGKEEAASTVHELSRRSEGPFVVVDCGAIPPNLLESHLFGHEKGAFTGASRDRVGAFVAADGGTLFLDEIGELPLDMQPALLRVLERMEVRPVGSVEVRKISVRIIAATHRDLRVQVGTGRFREDLYYRLAVVRVVLPALRERPDDIAPLIHRFLDEMPLDPETHARLTSAEFLAELRRGAWPGNVRELRNFLQRASILDDPGPVVLRDDAPLHELIDTSLPYAEARRRFLAHFEGAYAARVVERHDGNVSAAARAAGIGRSYLHRLLKRSEDG